MHPFFTSLIKSTVAAAAPNIIGVKLTCGSVGKLTRLVSLREDFAVLGGFVDFLGPSLLLKSAGGITGLANVAPVSFACPPRLSLESSSPRKLGDANPIPPRLVLTVSSPLQKSCLKLYNLTLSGLSGNLKDLAAASTLQELVSSGDWALQKGGISGTKYALQQVNGYGGKPRRPILEFEENGGDGKALMEELKPLVEYEKSL